MKKVLLAITSLVAGVMLHAQPCSELFISEVIEGSGNNKAMEIFNPTSGAINLSNYRIVRFSNGSTTGTDSLQLTGTLQPQHTWVVVNGQTVDQTNSPRCDSVLQAMADQLGGPYPDPLYENGNDALVLVKISPRAFVDIYGKIGEDPGLSWTDVFPYTDAQGTYWTKDHTLIRKPSVSQGVTVNPTAFNPTTEWDSLPKDTWSNLHIHNTNACGGTGFAQLVKNNAQVSVFPNPSNGNFTVSASQFITTVTVFNAVGEIVFVKNYGDNTNELQQQVDLTGLAKGLYFMQVDMTGGRRANSKLCIQ